MEAGYSPLELLAMQCPLLLRDLVAPRLKLRELGALRQSCSVLRNFVDQLAPLRWAWKTPMALAQRYTMETAAVVQAPAQQQQQQAEEDSQAQEQSMPQPECVRALRFMLTKVLPMQGKHLGTQAAFSLMVPALRNRDYLLADFILSHLSSSTRLKLPAAQGSWMAFGWDVVGAVVRLRHVSSVDWLLTRLPIMRLERSEVLTKLTREACFFGSLDTLRRLLDEPEPVRAMLDDEEGYCLTNVLMQNNLPLVQLVFEKLPTLRVHQLPEEGLMTCSSDAVRRWIENRRDWEDGVRRSG